MRSASAIIVLAVALLATGPAHAQECDDQVMFVTRPGEITCHHLDTEFNCCAWIDFEVDVAGFSIDIIEHEEFETTPCYCLCCFDNHVTVSGLETGLYLVSIWKDRLEGIEFVGSWEVMVYGESPVGVQTEFIPCAGTSVDQQLEGSWGLLKSLYR